MTIEKGEISEGAVFIEDPINKEVTVKKIQPVLGMGPKREVYVELAEKPGCGVWQGEELFASIHSKLPEPYKKSFLARLLRLLRFR